MSATVSPPPVSPRLAVSWWVEDHDSRLPLILGVIVAALLHGALAGSSRLASPQKRPERVEMTLYKPPPPPPPPPPPAKIEEPPPPRPEPEKPRPKPPPPREVAPPPEPPPPPPNQPPPPTPPSEPVPVVTGISMSSTVQGNSGFQVRVGNTTYGDPNSEKFVNPSAVKAYAGGSADFKAARASTLSKEAQILYEFKGPYPRDLAEQGVEGAVVMNLEITKTGTIRQVTLVKSSGNTVLDRLAREYMKRFRFAPAELPDGTPTDSVRRYVYRFELED